MGVCVFLLRTCFIRSFQRGVLDPLLIRVHVPLPFALVTTRHFSPRPSEADQAIHFCLAATIRTRRACGDVLLAETRIELKRVDKTLHDAVLIAQIIHAFQPLIQLAFECRIGRRPPISLEDSRFIGCAQKVHSAKLQVLAKFEKTEKSTKK